MLSPCLPATSDSTSRARLRQELETSLLETIPLARAMDLSLTHWDGESLQLSAPLAPNINDKGCAFGGSLASGMTLACWSLINLACMERGLECDIYVQDSNLRYLAPVWDDFRACARLEAGESFDAFFRALEARGKARLATECVIALEDGTPACSMTARFVAKRR